MVDAAEMVLHQQIRGTVPIARAKRRHDETVLPDRASTVGFHAIGGMRGGTGTVDERHRQRS